MYINSFKLYKILIHYGNDANIRLTLALYNEGSLCRITIYDISHIAEAFD